MGRRGLQGNLAGDSKTRGKNLMLALGKIIRQAQKTIGSRNFSCSGGCYNHSSSSYSWKTVHMLLTPALVAPCQRLEIRNDAKRRQEKSGSLFLFANQKNLDEKTLLAFASTPSEACIGEVDPILSLAQRCLSDSR
jgi:hypothetical protein